MNDLSTRKSGYATLLIRFGLNVQPGQAVMIDAEPDHADMVALCAAEAYRAGAKYVHVVLTDRLIAKQRFAHSAPENLDFVPGFLKAMLEEHARDDWARLVFTGSARPDAFDDVDPAAMQRDQVARYNAHRRYIAAQGAMQFQWCIAGVPTLAWARKVFPDAPEVEALDTLWANVLRATRADAPDPIAAWRRHDSRLKRVMAYLQSRRVRELHFLDPAPVSDGAPSTDLHIGLMERSLWRGGAQSSAKGVAFTPNVPTEEVFTSPHRERCEGYVRTSRPFFPLQREVSGAYLRFEGGEVVEARAEKGEPVLRQMLDIAGARRLGEVALVDVRSPVSQAGVLFHDTLFDENAACHIAFGRGLGLCLDGHDGLTESERMAAGLNDALAHVDAMIGTATLRVTGKTADGTDVVIIKDGRFTDDVAGADA